MYEAERAALKNPTAAFRFVAAEGTQPALRKSLRKAQKNTAVKTEEATNNCTIAIVCIPGACFCRPHFEVRKNTAKNEPESVLRTSDPAVPQPINSCQIVCTRPHADYVSFHVVSPGRGILDFRDGVLGGCQDLLHQALRVRTHLVLAGRSDHGLDLHTVARR